GGLKARPVDRGRVREDALELRPEFLGEEIALPSAGRAPVPVVVRGRHPVVVVRGQLGEQDLLLDPVANEVVDELEVVGAVLVHSGLAIAAGVARVGPRADVAGVDRRVHGQAPGASAATDSLRPAVPRALDTARSSVDGIERQTDANVDVLLRRLA